jgi:hypothetical protein
MSTTTVVQFMQKTADDKLLRDQLEALLGVGDGDISSKTAIDPEEAAVLKGDHAPIVSEFAAQHGFEFSAEDLITVVDALEKHQAGQLSSEGFIQTVGVAVPTTLAPTRRLLKFLSKTYLGY